jgi:hypothetical protein
MRLQKLDEERNGNGKRRYSEEVIAEIEDSIGQEFELWLEWQGLEELTGKNVATRDVENGAVAVSSLLPGMYYINLVLTDKNVIRRKFVKL